MKPLCGLAFLLLTASACTSGGSVAGDGPVPNTDGTTTSAPNTTTTTTEAADAGQVGDDPLVQAVVPGDPVPPPGLYVSPDGSDSNDGTAPDSALASIAFAVKQLNPGDTLWVLDGEYTESERTDSAILVTRSGTPDAWIRVAAYPGAEPVIRTNHKNGMKIDGASYVEIRGLTFTGTIDANLLAGGRYSGAGINVDGIYNDGGSTPNHHIRIIGNTISGYGAGGIPVTGASHVEIRDNVIFDVATVNRDQHSGISIFTPIEQGFADDDAGYSNYITGNTVYRVENTVPDPRLGRITDGNCIIMDLTLESGYAGRTLIANNLCVDNGGRGVQAYRSAHVDVVNNTLFGNSRSPDVANQGGDLGAFESSDIRFANNLVITTGNHAPARASGSTDVSFLNNVFVADREAQYGGHDSEGDQWIRDTSTAVVESAGITPDPAMFSLFAGSAAIDAGTDRFEAAVPRDFDGRTRRLGDTPDIGAFEFAG